MAFRIFLKFSKNELNFEERGGRRGVTTLGKEVTEVDGGGYSPGRGQPREAKTFRLFFG